MTILPIGGVESDMIWRMSPTQTESIGDPAVDPQMLDGLMTLLRRAGYLGLLDPAGKYRPDEAWRWLPTLVAAMGERGLPAGVLWQHLDRDDDWRKLVRDGAGEANGTSERLAEALSAAVKQINDQIEMSPQPEGEWAPVLATLGEDLLAALLGVSVSSVRRYAAGSRGTPQDVAERLHSVALVMADLAGSYNDFGIRRWWGRPRSQLGGRAPAALLGDFDPNGQEAAGVARLASSLVGAGAA